MGLLTVEAEVSAGVNGPRRVLPFLVDTGAIYSLLPEAVWRELDLVPTRTMQFTLADTTRIRRNVSECRFTVQGVSATSPVILGENGDEALLGAVTLESLGLVWNPFDRSLRPARMMLAAVG
jgi:predicted aspartyl protease